ncbi:hypothetical protein FRB94_002793, partial [Tulasnella sp. JGI-2019a]
VRSISGQLYKVVGVLNQGCTQQRRQLRSASAYLRLQIQQNTTRLDTALANLERLRIPLEHLEIDESFEIGRGGFGVVMHAKMLGYHSAVAVKRLRSDETRDLRVAKVIFYKTVQ